METIKLSLPAMYGDHHVVEVKRILSEKPGVEEVYASSAFQVVEIEYDPDVIDAEALEATLDDAGYLGEIEIPVEIGTVDQDPNGDRSHFRHSIAYEQTGQTVSFAREVSFDGRPLWPCPGIGVVRQEKEE